MSLGSQSLPPPTSFEQARIDLIRARNTCLTCGARGIELHHLLSGDVRIGHLFTIGLCRACHSQVKRRAFRNKHGSDQMLLNRQNETIFCSLVEIPSRRARKGATDTPSKVFPRNPERLA